MLNTVESILVLVDFQGKLAEIVDRSDLVLPNALRMVKGCQALEIPILPTLQVPEKLGPMMPELSEALEGGFFGCAGGKLTPTGDPDGDRSACVRPADGIRPTGCRL